MKKSVSLLVVGILILTGFGAGAFYENKELFNLSMSCSMDEYDMVIITSNKFSDNLQTLIDHKNSVGIKTFFKTTEEIYDEYEGRDNPEKIKYFIKDAIEQWNIKYVLLVGNTDLVPMRKTTGRIWISTGNIQLPTDHYYADVYDANGSFCSWDSNDNDKFGEFIWDDIWDYNWVNHTIDIVDLYPDVTIGRLLCSTKREVSNVVDKIITYETNTYGKEWFKRLILMGGDTSTYTGSTVYEGELVNDLVAQNLEEYDFNPIRLWTSLNTFKPMRINWELTKGAGLVCYSGHGFERGIATYPPLGDEAVFYDVLYLLGVLNGNKLPVVFLDACLTANPDYVVDMLGIKIPCFAWALTKKPFGGAIATIGSTREGYVFRSSGIPQAGASVLCINFFKSYEKGDFVGDIFTKAQNEYLDTTGLDYYTLEEFILYGDPSLKVGGYPTK